MSKRMLPFDSVGICLRKQSFLHKGFRSPLKILSMKVFFLHKNWKIAVPVWKARLHCSGERVAQPQAWIHEWFRRTFSTWVPASTPSSPTAVSPSAVSLSAVWFAFPVNPPWSCRLVRTLTASPRRIHPASAGSPGCRRSVALPSRHDAKRCCGAAWGWNRIRRWPAGCPVVDLAREFGPDKRPEKPSSIPCGGYEIP